MGRFIHFPKRAIEETLKEMRAEFKEGYASLIDDMCSKIRTYYQALPEFGGNKPKLIIGLSGGIDSTIVSYLAVKAVGAENVVSINMPAYEHDESIEKSDLVSKTLEIKQYTIPIVSIVDAEVKNMSVIDDLALSFDSNSEMDRMRIGNYASRTRVAVLYDVARKINGKILGTGNRTEFVQGYAAKWGTPLSFDFGVLDDLYKVDVYEIAKVLGVPDSIVDAAPTTGYYPGQTHEKELGATLEEQDVAAYLLFQKGLSKKKLVSKFGASSTFIDTMLVRYARSADKRMIRQEHIIVREMGGCSVQ